MLCTYLLNVAADALAAPAGDAPGRAISLYTRGRAGRGTRAVGIQAGNPTFPLRALVLGKLLRRGGFHTGLGLVGCGGARV